MSSAASLPLFSRPVLAFQLGVALAGLALLRLMAQQIALEDRSLALTLGAGAVLFDLTASALGLAVWRRQVRGVTGGAAVLLGGLLLGVLTLPSLEVKLLAGSLLEFLLLGWGGFVVWRALRSLGAARQGEAPLPQVTAELSALLPLPLARLLAHEALVWTSLRRGPASVPLRAPAFTSFRRSGRLGYVWLYVFGELPIHLALHLWHLFTGEGSGLFLWLLLGADASFALYLYALTRSYERFPSFIHGNRLHLHQGLLWHAELPLSGIVGVTPGQAPESRRLTLLTGPNVTLHLAQPATVSGVWGLQRRGNRLALFVDDVKAFQDALEEAKALRSAPEGSETDRG